jgi:membrane protein implicated in regulation of membrane protease activity
VIDLSWWHWVVLGFVLIGIELAVPSFYLIWFGLGALVVGLLTAIWPEIGGNAQIVVWTLASAALVFLWFRYWRPRTKSLAGSSDTQMVGEVGLLTRAIEPFARGEVRFQRPLAGSDQWPCIADEAIAAGERVRVTGAEGNLLRVARVQH